MISEQARQYGLTPMGVRPPLKVYLRDLFKRREFLIVLASSKAQAENQNSYLGQVWTILTPLLNSLVYVLIFGILLRTRAGMDNVIGYIVVGTFVYGFFSSTVTESARSIQSNIKLVQSLHFPRILLPLAVVFKDLIVLAPGYVVMMIIAQVSIPSQQGGGELHPERWILIIPATILLGLFAAGVGFILAKFAARVPDLLKLLPFILRVGMYASGVIFSIGRFVNHDVLRTIMEHQPVAVYLNLARQAALDESSIPIDWLLWLEGTGWAVAVFIIGFIVFWRDEARYGRE